MKALWVCFVWPEPESSAAGLRTMQLLEALQSGGWQVHVSSPCAPNSFRDRLEGMGFLTAHFEPNDSRFDVYVHELQPDLVIFDRFMLEEQFGWRVREQCPNALRVLDTVDLHFLRRHRQKEVAGSIGVAGATDLQALHSDDAIRELSSVYRSDLALVVSDYELEFLREHYGVPRERVALCRIFYPEPISGAAFSERKDFVVIGNFRHPPNLDAYRLLQRELWPWIRQRLPQDYASAELHVYGAYPNKEMMDLDNPKTGFRVRGWTPNAQETLSRYRVNLAPIRFGAGIKGKVLDGWSGSTPCVATSIAAEGLLREGFGGLVCSAGSAREEGWSSFVDAAVRLYSDPVLWKEKSERGAAILKSEFSRDRVVSGFMTLIQEALRDRETLRSRDFIGSMLWHHGARSTEYFSRWIEAKNKLIKPEEVQ